MTLPIEEAVKRLDKLAWLIDANCDEAAGRDPLPIHHARRDAAAIRTVLAALRVVETSAPSTGKIAESTECVPAPACDAGALSAENDKLRRDLEAAKRRIADARIQLDVVSACTAVVEGRPLPDMDDMLTAYLSVQTAIAILAAPASAPPAVELSQPTQGDAGAFSEAVEAAAREIFTSREIDWLVTTSEQRIVAAAAIIQRHLGPRIEALEAEAAAMRKALYDIGCSDEIWERRQMIDCALQALEFTAGAALLERHAAEVAELRERLKKALGVYP